MRFIDQRLNSSAMRYLATLLILLALSVSAAPQPASAQGDEAAWLLEQINALRQRNGLGALALNGNLAAAAVAHSTYLATHPYSDPHRENNGSTPQSRALDAGYPGRLVGENVVGGRGSNVQWAFNWWMKSPIHLHNMLAGWTEIGIGIVAGPYGRWYTIVMGTQGAGLVARAAQPDSPAGAARQPAPPRATRRPATRAPTYTPTATYTPSITYTPRPTFTPTFTPTGLPPTETPIVLEVSPQPTEGLAAVAFGPTVSPLPEPSAVSVAMAVDIAPPVTKAPSGEAIRALIPWLLLIQVVIVGGLIANSVVRRKRH